MAEQELLDSDVASGASEVDARGGPVTAVDQGQAVSACSLSVESQPPEMVIRTA
jgi:hypothetical protein